MNDTIQKPLSLKQAAEWLNLAPSYIYYLVHFGKLKAYKPGGKRLFFKVADLEKYAFSRSVGAMTDRADSILNAAQSKGKRVTA